MISIVVPLYNENSVIKIFHQALVAVISKTDHDFEVIYVDDCSTDGTGQTVLEIIGSEQPHYSRIEFKLVALPMNRGQMAAIKEGYRLSRGAAVITMDGDMQDPPEIVPLLIERLSKSNVEVVYARRIDRRSDSTFKRISALAYYWLVGKMSGIEVMSNVGEFRIITRRVVERALEYSSPTVVYRWLIPHLTSRSEVVEYVRPERQGGESHYSLAKMIRLARNSILEYADAPRIVFRVLGWLYTVAVVLFLFLIILGFQNETLERGWPTIVATVLFLLGVFLFVTRLILQYQKMIYDSIRDWPPN